MIDGLIRFAVAQRLLVLLVVMILIGAGLFSLQRLPIDAVPDVTNVQVQVLTAAPSLAPLEIERQITFPVEVAMSGLPDIEEIRSVSKFGLSAVTVVFDDNVDTYFARQLVLERLSQAREQIPPNIGSPEMGPISTGLGEIYQYELKAKNAQDGDATTLRTVQDWSVRRQLLTVPGVTEVNSFGGLEKQYQVRLDPAKLQAYGLTLRDVLTAVMRNNANVGGAYIEKGAEQYLLRGIGLVESASDIASIVVSKVRGAEDVKVEATSGLPQLQIKPDRAVIARYGINVEDVNDLIESIVAGKEAGLVYKGEQRFNLVVRLQEDAGRDVETIKALLVSAPNGARVPLAQLADIKLIEGPAQISREDTRRRIGIELNVRGRDIGSFVAEAQAALERDVKLPPGYYTTWGGQFENLQRASERLLIVVPLALFLIFILLFTTFNSVKQAGLIFTGIPFAIVGGVLALALRGMPFSISAGVGFIALFGVAVLNGVVMVSYLNHLREAGRALNDAVLEGALTRLRPVLMTALVASLGFIPMALGTSAGAEVQRPLATVVIGGLITSTLLTLLLLPMLYRWFERDDQKHGFTADTEETIAS